MSNRKLIVKLSFIAAVFVFASCHSDVPDLPTPEEVAKYKYCGYTDKNNVSQCKSPYVISKEDCEKIPGHGFFSDKDCKPASQLP